MSIWSAAHAPAESTINTTAERFKQKQSFSVWLTWVCMKSINILQFDSETWQMAMFFLWYSNCGSLFIPPDQIGRRVFVEGCLCCCFCRCTQLCTNYKQTSLLHVREYHTILEWIIFLLTTYAVMIYSLEAWCDSTKKFTYIKTHLRDFFWKASSLISQCKKYFFCF